MSENRSPRRTLIMAPKAEVVHAGTPRSEIMLADALSILHCEITNLKSQVVAQKRPLDMAQSRILTGYIKSLTDIMREQREAQAEMDLANMSDSELLALVEQLKNNKEPKSG